VRDACLADRHLIGATLTEAALAELDDHVEPTLDEGIECGRLTG